MNKLVKQLIEDIKDASIENKVCITISTTSGNETSYLTPIRMIPGMVIMGCVVHSTELAKQIVEKVSDDVNYIFIDIEKKLAPSNIDGNIDTRNIYHPLRALLKDVKKIFPYKPNDITVDAVYEKVIDECLRLRNCTVGIIGLGNIGTKLSLKLVESGVDICVLPRKNTHKELNIVNSLNAIKHKGAIASVILIDNIFKLLIKSDIILACSTNDSILDKESIPFLKDKKLVLDIGKKNISSDVMLSSDKCAYCDVTPQLIDYIINKVGHELSALVNEQYVLDSSFYPTGSLLARPGTLYSSIKGKLNFLGSVDENQNFERFSYKEIIHLRKKYVL